MRDTALTLVFGVLLLMVFKNPAIGAYLWAWFSLMNPHKLTYGFAYSLPFAYLVALVSIVTLMGTQKRRALPLNAITVLWFALVAWMCVTSLFALNRPELVFDRWLFVFKIHAMLFVSLMLIIDEKQFKTLVVVVTLSVAFFGIKGGIFTVATGGAYRVWGPPSGMLAGNNEAAVGFVALVPYLYWMRDVSRNRWIRLGLAIAMALTVFSILGTHSRGAIVAVAAMAFFLGLKSQHPVRMSLLMAMCLLSAVMFMPDNWVQRMDTIGDYQEDTSAMSRLWTWTTMWNAAVDRPLVGVGFRADVPIVFQRYAPTGGEWAQFSSISRVWVAHSIYFQILGEHGFVGLLLYLSLWLTVWLQAGRLARRSEAVPALASWLPSLMRMTQASLIGYAVGGAFLSLAYLDLPYYFMGYVVLGRIFVDRALAGSAVRPGIPAPAAERALPPASPGDGAPAPR